MAVKLRLTRIGKKKQPVHFRMTDGSVFAFVALWDVWTDGTHKEITCCTITTEADELGGRITPGIASPLLG